MSEAMEHFDVIIVGAGLSGVGAAYHLQTRLPGRSYAILEGRDAMGGTWDLFRYPGIRSDSDMFTLGYRFRPWREAKAIADGPSIRHYVKETAAEYGIDRHIRFSHWVTDYEWSSADARWTVSVDTLEGPKRFTCNFVWNCSGYYKYAEGYTPDFPGAAEFKGRIVHPQHWPEDLDYKGKKVVVIGSGATAVTLIPSMADEAAHIVMLQRSPTYMFALPGTSQLAKTLSSIMPKRWAYFLMRWQRILFQQWAFRRSRKHPDKMREFILKQTTERLPEGYDVETHFSPDYNPWDQRVCAVPDDDLFEAIKSGKAEVVTDHIDTFVENGIRLKSGRVLETDIIITATGLILELLGGASVTVDGEKVNFGDTFTYKGLMFSGVPNMASVFGYTNASWTLRADLVADYVCRLMKHMDEKGFVEARPVNDDPVMVREPFLDFSSGYVLRAVDRLPKQGTGPWRHSQNYLKDLQDLRKAPLEDGAMRFRRAGEAATSGAAVMAAE